ncbi:hypothetical protein J4457_07430 [Candidatus Woesearchaeota archaeon]|nr:hypothetical protein [Candidatus Woesearchaeota archaeon]
MVILILIILIGCVKQKFEKENKTVVPEYEAEKDIQVVEEAQQKTEELQKAWQPKTEPVLASQKTCNEAIESIKNTLTKSRNCMRHSDCGLATVEFACVGSYFPVNKDAIATIMPLLKFLDEKCDVGRCTYRKEHMSVACVNYQCTKVARTG